MKAPIFALLTIAATAGLTASSAQVVQPVASPATMGTPTPTPRPEPSATPDPDATTPAPLVTPTPAPTPAPDTRRIAR